MGKNIKYFFSFAYRLLHFIVFIPIKIIKYFFMGFFCTFSVLLELLVGIVVLLSFCIYKVLKYILLFFCFPIIILNKIKLYKKTSESEKIIFVDEEEPIVLPDNNVSLSDTIGNNKNKYQFESIDDDNVLVLPDIDDQQQDDKLFDNNYITDIKTTEASEKKVEDKRRYIFFNKVMTLFKHICFGLYKLIKYVVLSLTFPYLIYNLIKNNKKIENIDDIKINNKDALDIDGEKSLTINDNDISYTLDKDEDLSVDKTDEKNIYTEQFNVISDTAKAISKKKKFSLIVLLEYVCFPIYKMFKYLYLGIAFILYGLSRLFTLLSFLVYKIVKYLLYSLTLPIIILNLLSHNPKIVKNRKIKEERRLAKHEEKFKRQLKNQQRQEDQLRQEIKNRRKNEEYVNENVKIEKKTFKEKVDEALNEFFNLPKKIKTYINNKITNSVFVKNRRNKLDINRQALLIDFEGEDAEKSDFKVVYQYTAKNKEGKIITDYFEAFSKVEVHSYLLSEGYEVYNIKTNRWIQFAHQNRALSKVKIKNKYLIFFLTQLSTYIKAGIPLVDSLKIVSRQFSKNKNYKRLFDTIIYDLTMGESFSTSLSKQGEAFPKILINMVKASEMTGELPEVLDDMADYFNEIDKTRKQMVTALMYPIIVFVLSIGVIVFIMLFVIPRFVSIYESIDASQIPKFTLAILAISDFLKKYIIHLTIIVLVIIIVLRYLYKNIKSFRTICQWFFMHIPVVKNVIIYNEVTTFTKTFASLLGHNVFITDSMEILNRVTNNEIYKMLIFDTITNLAKGEKISTSFKDHWAFPVPAYEMLVTGEQTGQLPEMMAKVADYYQELHKNSVTRIKTFIEPVLIIFLTAVVGTIVLAIVVPMISLYQTVQNYG